MVVSGAVFVFDVAEAAMKRWTDGKMWSPSRIDGNFLVSGDHVCVMPFMHADEPGQLYRELSEKKAVVVISNHFEEWTPAREGATGSGSRPRARVQRPTPPVPEPPPTSSGFKLGGLSKKVGPVERLHSDG